MKVYCTRPRQQDEAPHLTEIPEENLSKSPLCAICGMPLILQGRYVPTKELGRGGFGYTFLARDLKFGLQAQRVLKQFRSDLLLLPSAIAQAKRAFQREYEILDRLKHQQIPRVYEPFDIQTFPDLRAGGRSDQQLIDYYYFVQEYIEGEDLDRCLKDDRLFAEIEVRAILQQMLQVLQYIYSQPLPIIHRDIKTSNIIHSDDGNFYLIDFGAAKRILSEVTVGSTQAETVFVSKGFSPPEQYHGIVNFSSDLYALGKTCICLLEGTILPPNPWKPTTTISDSLVRILDRMTADNPNHRYNSITTIMDELSFNSSSNSSMVVPNLVTVTDFNHQQLDTQKKQQNSHWFKKIGIGAGITITLLGIAQVCTIFFPPIQVTKFKPPQYHSIDNVQNVPADKFKSCCSKTWIPLSSAVNPIIKQSFRTFKLESVSPDQGELRNSEAGIEMLIDGKIDIALSSKQITSKLLQQAADKNVQLMETTIARGSTAVVVHPNLQIQGITMEQFERIKNGEITNWKKVGGADIPINIYITDRSYLGKNVQPTQLSDTTTSFKEVARNPGGFTIAPSNLAVIQCQVKTLSIGIDSTNLVSPYRQQQGLSPSKCNRDRVNIDVIKDLSYPLTSDLKVFMRADDSIRKKVGQAYVTMLMTTELQQRIEEAGYLPISKIK
jgi:serine/threonine protein kinase